MSYAIQRARTANSAGPAVSPPPPTTATVYDFACLFTHDLKRKQKRWQDGKLKYHSFNKRVMVYDERDHFVGDSHWTDGDVLAEGDEIELDRGNAIVQVADCTGQREQDLTEVLDKRAREVEKRRQMLAAKQQTRIPHPDQRSQQRPQHLSLSTMLQSPGPIGRAAIPDHSPYEARRRSLHQSIEPRHQQQSEQPLSSKPPPAKKRRTSVSPPSKAGYAQSLFGTRLTLSGTPAPDLVSAARARALRERTNMPSRVQEEASKSTGHSQLIFGRTERAEIESSPLEMDVPTPSKAHARSAIGASIKNQDAVLQTRKHANRSTEKRAQAVNMMEELSTPQHETANGGFEKWLESGSVDQSNPETSHYEIADQDDLIEKVSTTEKFHTLLPQSKQAVSLVKEPKQVQRPEVLPRSTEQPIRKHHKARTEDARAAEPRTELRIKARKRRGLLMIAESFSSIPQQNASLISRHSAEDGENSVLSAGPKISEDQPCIMESNPALKNGEAEPLTVKSIPEIHETETELPAGSAPELQEMEVEVEAEAEAEAEAIVSALGDESELERTLEDTQHSTAAAKIVSSEMSQAGLTKLENDCEVVEAGLSEVEVPSTPLKSPSQGPASMASPDNVASAPLAESPVSSDSLAEDKSIASSSPPKLRSRRRLSTRRKVRAPTPEESELSETSEEEQAEPPVAQGPRIARLARKSIRSREIIGYIPPQEQDIIPAQFAASTVRLDSRGDVTTPVDKAVRDPIIVKVPSLEQGLPPSCAITQDAPAAVPTISSSNEKTIPAVKQENSPRVGIATLSRTTSETSEKQVGNTKTILTNPATRGKKAARKEDAAGREPQVSVPFEATTTTVTRAGVANAARRGAASTTPLPGFSKANGGAWSRHAEDLLGMTRPGGEKSKE